MAEESESSEADLSSDEELQLALARGTIKPGLVGKVAPPKTYTNNVSGLREALAALKRRGQSDWLERMAVTCRVVSPGEVGKQGEEEGGDGEREEKELDPNDDFKREMWFYQQALSAVEMGHHKLQELDVPTTRPEDYFAEMVKTDDHMRKVRERLLSRQKGLEQREKARKLRELKKFGKKVQQDILQKRREEKKTAMKSLKKGKGEKAGATLRAGKKKKGEAEKEEEEFAVSASRDEEPGKPVGKKNKRGAPAGKKSKKQQFKDKKFGFGGRKRGQKSNSAKSSADMSGFTSARHSKPSHRGRGRQQRGRK